jgi:serine/threonine-protein kinase
VEAAALCRELLRQSVPDRPRVASFQLTLALALRQQGRLDEAEALAGSALAMRIAQYGAGDWRVAEANAVRGSLLVARGDLVAAEPLLLESDSALERRWPGPNRRTRRLRSDLSSLYQAWGRPDRAAAYSE